MDWTDITSLGGVLYDPHKGDRSLAALREGQADANQQLDTDTAQQFAMLEDAGIGRSLGQNLGDYDQGNTQAQQMTQRAGDLAMGQANAGSPDQVQQNLNPQMDAMLDATMQRVQGSAGAALQSGAATRAASQAVAKKAGDLWQQAFNNTMNQAQNNLNVASNYGQSAGQIGNLVGQRLAADNQPMEDWLDLKNDVAMQRYAGQVGLTQAAGQNAGQDQSLFGQILGG